jgi:citrate synthase
MDVSRSQGVYGDHCLLLECIEDELEAAVGRRIAANIDGVSAALLSDLDLDPRLARPILMAPRSLSLAAHFLEEQDQNHRWRHVPNSQVTYTGAPQAEPT